MNVEYEWRCCKCCASGRLTHYPGHPYRELLGIVRLDHARHGASGCLFDPEKIVMEELPWRDPLVLAKESEL